MTSFSPAARRPAHATALGKALLAFAARRRPPAGRDGVAARLTPRALLTRPTSSTTPCTASGATGRALDRGELIAHVWTVAVPVLGPGDIALAAVEVEVEDLSAETVAAVTPVLTLAAHGLSRELHPSWRRERAGPPHAVRRGGARSRAG